MLIPAFSMLIKQGTACAVEGDIKVSMAMSILKTIAGCGQLSEMYSIDFNEDICIIGHSGSGDADISKAKKPTMKIVPVFHGKTGGGYLTQFYPPVGDVTYLAITQDKDGHFKFVVAEGVNEPGPIFTFGDTNMRTRFSCGAREPQRQKAQPRHCHMKRQQNTHDAKNCENTRQYIQRHTLSSNCKLRLSHSSIMPESFVSSSCFSSIRRESS